MSHQHQIRRLEIADSQSVQDCYDSQPKLMLVEKSPNEAPYASTFQHLLFAGCVSFGAFDGHELKAFATFWPWPTLPASTLVLAVNRPDGMLYNPERSGLQAVLNAGLSHMEADGRTSVYFARSGARRWKHSLIKQRLGRLGEYHASAVERIPAGQGSRFEDFNRFVLGGRSVRGDAVMVHAVAPQVGDF
jgi:hypothetical protein